MNKIFLLIFFAFTCCTKKNNSNQTEKLTPSIDTTSLFLGLSPKMNSRQFNETLVDKEKQGILKNKNFTIEIDDTNLNFKIAKLENSIVLNHQINNTLLIYNVKNSNDLLVKYRDLISNLSNLGKSKTELKRLQKLIDVYRMEISAGTNSRLA